MTTLPQRILFIARELTEGGAAFLAIRHLKRLARNGRQIDFLITGPVSEALSAKLNGITIHTSGLEIKGSQNNRLTPRETCVRIYPCLTQQYDIVVGSSLFPDMTACLSFSASRARRKLLVLLDEGLIIPNLGEEIKAAMQCAIISADHLVPVSQALLDRLAQCFPILKEIPKTVIFPPIETQIAIHTSPFTYYASDERPHVVTAARLDQIKQIPVCLRTHWELRREGVDFHWHVIGDGPERDAIEQEVAQLDMADRFHIEGFKIEPRAWMKYADLFVLTSRSEGCPTVIREALAEGTPVLSTDVNGVRELIDDGITGIVLADCTADLKANLRLLITDRNARERLRQNIVRLPTESAGQETDQLSELFQGESRPRLRPDVTILIPTYNHGWMIHRAIESALMQDYYSLEVVVCDDASTDETEAVAERYGHDPRMTYVRRPSNLGRVVNYQNALKINARGDWVLVLDGDDFLTDPCFISRAMNILLANQAAQPLFLQAGHRVVFNTTNDHPNNCDFCAAQVDILPEIEDDIAIMQGEEYLRLIFRTGFFSHLGTIYLRSAALEQGFYTKNISSADMDSLLRLATRGNVIVMKKIAGVWFQHGRNNSGNVPIEQIKENVRIFREISQEVFGKNAMNFNKLNAELIGYEARVLKHLFGTTIGKSATGPIDALKMLAIMMKVNPRVFLNKDLMRAWQGWAKHLTYLSVRHIATNINRIITRYIRRQ